MLFLLIWAQSTSISLFNVTQQELVLSKDKFPSHLLYVCCIDEQHMDEMYAYFIAHLGTAWAHWIRATPIR